MGLEESGKNNRSVFWGRLSEKTLLQKKSQTSQLTVLYGRRRVGKTRLIEEAFRNKAGVRVLKIEGLEGLDQKAQKNLFLKTVADFFDKPLDLSQGDRDWIDLLKWLSQCIGTAPAIVFFDEFQWLAGEKNILVSQLKYAWDNYFQRHNTVHIIVCGSISSFMINHVLKSKALYGRITSEICLQPLHLQDCVTELTKKRSLKEIVELFMFVGGIPQYLNLFDLNRSVRINVQELFFQPHSYFSNEYERLFASHFGKNQKYHDILKYLSTKTACSRVDIQNVCKLGDGGRVSEYLDNLEGAGFVACYQPVDKLEGVRGAQYRINDPYIDFYFRFIKGNSTRITKGVGENALTRFLPDATYYPWRGLAFERFCLQHERVIAQKLGFGGIGYDAGTWFERKNKAKPFQIDLMFIRADKVITICEIKFLEKRVGLDVIKPMEKRIERFPNNKKYTIEKVLVTATAPTEQLKNEGYFNAILTIEDLFL